MTTKRKTQILSAVQVRAVKEPGMYGDGDGLYLRVDEFGNQTVGSTHHHRRETTQLGIGRIPGSFVGSSPASCVRQCSDGQGRARSSGKKREIAQATRKPAIPTFAEAATIVIDMRRPTWSNEKHAYQWTQSLTTYAYPIIGNQLVSEITSADVLSVLASIWTTKSETDRRVRQ